ncbi:MAG: hypothetical protein ACJ8F7_08675 [Gemmataceae bacterium]
MSANENRTMTGRPNPAQIVHLNDKPAVPPAPQSNVDPIDAANHLWALRLWLVCALAIVSFTLASFLLNHWLY